MVATHARDASTLSIELSAANAEAIDLCKGLTEAQLVMRPHPEKWSIAENLLHLCTTTEVFLPAVDGALVRSRHRGVRDAGPFHLGWYGRLLVWYVEPPPVIRLPAPRVLRPHMSCSLEGVLEKFLGLQAAMRQRMEESGGVGLTALRFQSPLASFIRMNLLEFFSVFNAHSRRHLWQAANVRRDIQIASGADCKPSVSISGHDSAEFRRSPDGDL